MQDPADRNSEHAMQTDDDMTGQAELLAQRREMWNGFMAWSTRAIVVIALVLIVMALSLV